MTIKTILILGAFNPGAIENYYKHGFESCGVSVDTLGTADQYNLALNKSIINKVANKISPDIFYKPVNRNLLRFINNKSYDVILIFKGMELFPETISSLKKHALILANYNADHPFIYFFPGSGNENVLNSISLYDVHFSYSNKIVEEIRSRFSLKAYRIPFGYNSHSPKPSTNLSSVYSNKFLFIGAYDKERADFLNKLKSQSVDIYGDSKWKSRNVFRPFVRKAYMSKALYGEDYVNGIASSMGIINLLRKQNLKEDSHNMRSFEVPGFGGLLVSQKTGEQQEFFEENKEAVFFETLDELRDKLDYLSKNGNIVQTMKEAAYSRCIRANYSYDQRSMQLLTCLKEYF